MFIGAIVGFTAYIWLLRHVEPAKVATYTYGSSARDAVCGGNAFAPDAARGVGDHRFGGGSDHRRPIPREASVAEF